MDRMQQLLAVSLSYLGVPINIENFQEICDVAYLCKQRGIDICSPEVKLNPKSGRTYSPTNRMYNWGYAHNLRNEIQEIVTELDSEKWLREKRGMICNTLREWKLDKESRKKLDNLKSEIIEKGIERCLREAFEKEKVAA